MLEPSEGVKRGNVRTSMRKEHCASSLHQNLRKFNTFTQTKQLIATMYEALMKENLIQG